MMARVARASEVCSFINRMLMFFQFHCLSVLVDAALHTLNSFCAAEREVVPRLVA